MEFKKIGEIHSPYDNWAPHQSPERESPDKEAFKVVLDAAYEGYLKDLDSFTYIYVLYYLDRQDGEVKAEVSPPAADGKKVGLFASRSPRRPNPVGLAIVRLLEVRGCELLISPIDAFNHTPVIDIKPYMKGLDSKQDANYGWLEAEGEAGAEHLMQHLRGLPHDHSHDHDHGHDHDHDHDHGDHHHHHHGDGEHHHHHHHHDDDE